jgi:hypothetical protein
LERFNAERELSDFQSAAEASVQLLADVVGFFAVPPSSPIPVQINDLRCFVSNP